MLGQAFEFTDPFFSLVVKLSPSPEILLNRVKGHLPDLVRPLQFVTSASDLHCRGLIILLIGQGV